MSSLAKMLSFLTAVDGYEKEEVANDNVGKMIIDTCNTPDEGYETAIMIGEQWHPVERYTSKEDALTGHNKWKEKLPTLTEIENLGGWDGLVPAHTVKITQ